MTKLTIVYRLHVTVFLVETKFTTILFSFLQSTAAAWFDSTTAITTGKHLYWVCRDCFAVQLNILSAFDCSHRFFSIVSSLLLLWIALRHTRMFTPKSKPTIIGDSFTPSQRISLSLSDLQRSTEKNYSQSYNNVSTQDSANYMNSSSSQHNQSETKSTAEYKRELGKLLAKSKGTPYEYMLKRFVENKLKDMIAEDDRQNERLAHYRSPERPSLATLSTSRFDSPNRLTALYVNQQLSRSNTSNSLRSSQSPQSRQQQQQQEQQFRSLSLSPSRLDAMSLPLERHKYKVCLHSLLH